MSRFPLDKKKVIGYDYGVPTNYGQPHHLGVDWEADFVPLHAPKDGTILNISEGPQAGKAILFQPKGEKIAIRWVHLDKFYVIKGQSVQEGDIIALTGNSGSNTTNSHLHEDVWKNGKVTLKFEDTINPHTYYAQKEDSMILVEHNGTYYVEGEKGYYGIAKVEYLNLLLQITGKIEHRPPVGAQLGVVDTAPEGFIIKGQ